MQANLKKVLRPVHVWALAVGLVISGEYFGWNYGWNAAGTIGFLLSTLLVTIMYTCFLFSFTELTSAIPDAGGPFAYALRALGTSGGLIAGYASLVEFLLAPPAIAYALGSYVHFLHPSLAVLPVAIVAYLIFSLINLLGVKESAVFNLIITLLAIIELLVFMGIVAPAFKLENFIANNSGYGISGVIAALPFAIWFYLAIEGVAMVSEEVKDPQRTFTKGYGYGLATLVALALGVMIFTAGVGDWKTMSTIDYPLPEAIGRVLGQENRWTKIFAGIGLFGLIASFHGIIICYSRQIFALARNGYLPIGLSAVNKRFQTPHWAIIAGGLFGIGALFTGTTDKLIIVSVMGALLMYIISLVSLFALRRKEPALHRPFKTPFYPLFPVIALILSLICLLSIIWFNPWPAILFFAGLGISYLLYHGLSSKNS